MDKDENIRPARPRKPASFEKAVELTNQVHARFAEEAMAFARVVPSACVFRSIVISDSDRSSANFLLSA